MPRVESGDRLNSLLASAIRRWSAIPPGLFLFLALIILPQPAWGQANVQGQWATLPTQMPINPVHVAMMHNGKVLIVSGSGNVAANTSYMAGVWDPATDTVTTQSVAWDMFCNGMVVLPDGRPFIMSGTLQYDPFHGQLRTSAYDPATGNFVDLQPMAHGRWYPTATTLGNGNVMIFSGLDENGNTNTTVEIYQVGVGWSQPFSAPWTPPLYPRMHLLPNGNVFYSGSTTSSAIFNPSTHVWTTGVATTNYSGTRTYGSSVLLPLTPANGYDPRVIIMGGGSPATFTTEIIDLGSNNPKWVFGPNMSAARIEMDAVMLPTGNVLILNGSVNDEDASTASLGADLYNTTTNTISSAGSGAFARLYHSGALLLPDATVLVLGGNPQRGTYEPHMEIYSPAYLFNSNGTLATRPTITGVPTSAIGYGNSFQIQTPDAANISSAVLVRAGAPTHAFDMDQRLVGLSFTVGNGFLTATAPPNGNIAPPGYYHLFLLNSAGVPSVAQFVQLSSTLTNQAPTGTITSPVSNVTITPGQSVTFAGTGTSPNSSIASYSWVFPGGSPSSSALANPGAVTYSTAGSYVASLTVTDNLGVSDPNPPTRTITVSPDFSLSISPASQNVPPGGGTASYMLTVSAGTGFTSTVSFSAAGLPAGASASFSPSSISGSGSTTLTVTTTSSTPVGGSTLTITGTASALSHSASALLTVSSNRGSTGNPISIQFVGNGVAMASSEVAGVLPLSNWNNAEGASSGSPMSLTDSTGNATTATVSWRADDTWLESIADQPGDVRMMRGYLDNGAQDTTTVNVSGLPGSGSGYNVYVYAEGSTNGSNTGIYQISGAGITTTSTNLTYTSEFNGTFTQANNSAGNYVVFTIPTVTAFTLSAIPSTASSIYERAPLNGIQIVPIGSINPNFTITSAPGSATIGSASSASYTITVGAVNGFTGPVTLTASGLPSGTTATFSPATIATSGSSTMTLSTSASTPAGTSTVTITGTAGSLTNSASVTLIVSGPDFTLSAAPSSFSVVPGGTATYTMTVGALFGFTGQVNLAAAGLPSGATASFSPTSITQAGSSTLTVILASNTPPGSNVLTITGTSAAGATHTATVTLSVGAPPDFTLSASPSSFSVNPGGTATYTVSVGALSGFGSAVNLGVTSGLPSGATATFSPASITTSGSSTLTVTTTGSTPIGNPTLTITGTSGALTHTATVNLIVTTSSTSGNPISIQFVGNGVAMASSEVAGVVALSHWNNAGGASSGSPMGLTDSAGSATTATVSWKSDDTWLESIADQAGNVRMMRGYLDNGAQDTTTVSVTGLPVSANGYHVYVYAEGSTTGSNTGIYQISGTGITTTSTDLTYTSEFNGTFTQANNSAGNYVVFTIPNVTAFTLSAIPSTSSSGYERAPVNGIQIVPVGSTNPDFTLSATPGTQTVNAGAGTTYTLNVGALNGFAGSVTLSASGLPAGGAATFSPASISSSGSSTITITTSASTPAGSSTLTITGTSGAVTHTATLTLTVLAPDFTIAATPAAQTVVAGGSTTYTVNLGVLNGFGGAVALTINAGLPSGATASFAPSSVTGAGSSTLTVATTSNTPVGSPTLTITGTSGALTHTTTVTLNITGPPDFTLSASPSSFSVNPGGTATYTVSVGALSGFSSVVNLGVTSGLPSGATATFSPASITTSGNATLTVATTGSTPIGNPTLTITGTSGTLTHTATVNLIVTTSSTSGNPISIQFVGNGVAMASSEVAGVVALSHWNNAEGASSGSPMSLADSAGSATTATVSWKSDDTWLESIADQAGNVRMMRGYLDNGAQDTTTVNVSGLPGSVNGYNVYVYAEGSTSGSNVGIYQISGTGITTTSTNLTYTGEFNGTFTQANNSAGNYVVFTIPNVTAFTLSAIPSTASSGYERAPVNGIQIVPR